MNQNFKKFSFIFVKSFRVFFLFSYWLYSFILKYELLLNAVGFLNVSSKQIFEWMLLCVCYTGSCSVPTRGSTTSPTLTTTTLSALCAVRAMPFTWHQGALSSSTNSCRVCDDPSRAARSCGRESWTVWPQEAFDYHQPHSQFACVQFSVIIFVEKKETGSPVILIFTI